MKKAFDFCFGHLFCKKTNLFYDHLYDLSEEGATKFLPTIESIHKQQPNPNGWSTGMEDSVLCGSMMLDVVLNMYKIAPSENLRQIAKDIYNGLMLCACVSKEKGFIARSVSPIDKISHYSNSSRDQYTHFVYSMFNYSKSEICECKEREQIALVFKQIADRCERYCTKENDYEFPREDGKKGLCFKMWGEIGFHEYLRLPMFYLATYKVTDEKKYKDLYLKYRDEAIEKSFCVDYENQHAAYPILQMQYSLKFISDNDCEAKERCASLMQNASKSFATKAKEYFRELQKHKDTLCYKYNYWQDEPSVYIGKIGGIDYYNHNQDIYEQNKAYYILRNIADSVAIVALYENADADLLEILQKSCDLIDFSNHYTNAPVYLLNAYFLSKQSKKHLQN